MSKPEVTPVTESAPDWVSGPFNVLGLSTAFAGVFLFAELLIAVENPFWAGGTTRDWIETAQAYGVYATLIAAGALLPFCVIAPLLMNSALRLVLSVLLPAGVAFGAAFYIDSRVADVAPSVRMGVPVVLGIIAGAALILGVMRAAQPGNMGILFVLALAGGLGTLYLSAGEFLLDAERATNISTAAVLWLAISACGAVLIVLLTLTAWPRWLVRVGLAAMLCGAYPGYLFARPFFDRLEAPSERKNVLLITIDTLRADYCSTYGGSVPTPNLDELARRGTLFERHYSLAPWTVPSINGLMTSKFPPGLTPNAPDAQRMEEEKSYQRLAGYWLDRDGVTHTKRLGNLGYATAAVYANPTIQFHEWLTHGFEGSRMVNQIGDPELPLRFRQTPVLRELLGKYRPELLDVRVIDSSALVTEFGLTYLRQHRTGPFFLWLHFMDPHTPYDPPARFRDGDLPEGPFGTELSEDEERAMTDEEKRVARRLYEGEIRYVDDCVGLLLYALRKHGLEENTYICLSSDHGEEFWEHGRWGHGYDLYDEQVNVPLIIAGPRIRQNRIKTPVSAIDVLPTLAELLGTAPNPEWHGTSFAPVLFDGDEESLRRPVYSQATHFFRYDPEPTQMVVDRNLKLVVGVESGRARLYDLSDDPNEETNLADSLPEEVERLMGLLEVWSSGFPSNFDEVAGWQGSGGDFVPNEDLDETLKALGYTN